MIVVAFLQYTGSKRGLLDFDAYLYAADALIDGDDPYARLINADSLVNQYIYPPLLAETLVPVVAMC